MRSATNVNLARVLARAGWLLGLGLVVAVLATPAFAGGAPSRDGSSVQEKPAWQPSPAPAPAPPPAASKPSYQPSPSARGEGSSGWRATPPSSAPGARDPRPHTPQVTSPPPPTTGTHPGGRPQDDWRHDRRYPHRGYYWHGSWYPYGLWWDFYGYPYYWGSWPYNWGYGAGYGYGYGYGYPRVYPNDTSGMGALDCDISPENTQIYVDGQYVGICDDFDGFPAYLWLDKGTYDVVFYLPGYKTLARQYSIYPGLVIDVEDRMTPGEAVKPEDLVSKSTERRDARIEADRDRAREAEAQEREPAYGGGGEAPPGAVDARRDPGRLRLQVAPTDASIYLDGRFIGTGEEISRLHSGLIVDPGEHRLEVVRPDYQAETQSFEVASGEEVTLQIQLDKD